MDRINVIVAILSVWSVVPLIYSYLFYTAGRYTEAYWLVAAPAGIAIFAIIIVMAASSENLEG